MQRQFQYMISTLECIEAISSVSNYQSTSTTYIYNNMIYDLYESLLIIKMILMKSNRHEMSKVHFRPLNFIHSLEYVQSRTLKQKELCIIKRFPSLFYQTLNDLNCPNSVCAEY